MGQTKWAEFETWRLPWRPTWRQLYWKLLDSLWYNRQRPKKLRLGLTCHWQTGCTNHRADDEAVTSPAGSPNRTKKKPLTPASVRRSFANTKKKSAMLPCLLWNLLPCRQSQYKVIQHTASNQNHTPYDSNLWKVCTAGSSVFPLPT